MEHAYTFLVLTLLQLSRAEIPKPLPEWYAANLINDANYSPKPLTEIFSTDPSFTSRNTDATQSSSQLTSTSTPWPTPSSATNTAPNTNPTLDNSRNAWTQDTTQLIPRPQPLPVMSQIAQNNPPQGQRNQGQQPGVGGPNINWALQTPPPAISNPTINPINSQPPSPQTGFPTQSSTPSLQGNQFGGTVGSIWNLNQNGLPPNQITNIPPGFQPYFPLSIAQRQSPIPLPSDNLNSPCNSRPFPTSTQFTSVANIRRGTNNATQTSGPASLNPLLTISVKRRKGSKTNVLINPSTSTTTNLPSTTKRANNRRNKNFEACLDACKDRKDPICGSPRGVTPINPDTLKGFGSLCHLACHNSYRNQQYEKIADGRCGKLRTRIRPVDQDSKLNREDLNKAQYNIIHNGGETLIEFAQLLTPSL